MEQRTIVMIVALFVLIVAGMFVFALMKNDEINEEPVTTPADESTEPGEDDAEGPYSNISRIDAKHFYIDGTHTLAGEVMMPTPCDLLEANASVAESMPEQVTIAFTVTNEADMCAQVITPQRFMVSFDASPEATFSATLEGRAVELNVFEAEEGETPEDFELFIKG